MADMSDGGRWCWSARRWATSATPPPGCARCLAIGGRDRRRGHPAARPAGPGPRHHRHRRGSSPTSRATRNGVPPNWSRLCGAARSSRRDRRWHAERLRPRLPAGPRRPRRRFPGHRRARAERGDHRAGAVRAALRPVLLRGLPAAHRQPAGGPGCGNWPPSSAPWSSSRRRTGSPARSTDLAAAFGADRSAAVCRELTKTYEEVRRGALGELAAWAADGETARRDHPGRGGRPAGPAERPSDEDTARGRSPSGRPPATTRRDAISAVADGVRPAQTRGLRAGGQ